LDLLVSESAGESFSPETACPPAVRITMSKKSTGVASGNSEAIRIYERMQEEQQRKVQAKAEANKPKKVTLPRLKFMDET
jgi:hypothetical protein